MSNGSDDKVLYQLAARMNTMEAHLDEVRQAVVKMARTEERVTIVLEQQAQLFKKYGDIERKMNDIRIVNATQSQSIGLFERIGWLVFTAAIGAIGFFKSGGG